MNQRQYHIPILFNYENFQGKLLRLTDKKEYTSVKYTPLKYYFCKRFKLLNMLTLRFVIPVFNLRNFTVQLNRLKTYFLLIRTIESIIQQSTIFLTGNTITLLNLWTFNSI